VVEVALAAPGGMAFETGQAVVRIAAQVVGMAAAVWLGLVVAL
jgi:hypothetical protein